MPECLQSKHWKYVLLVSVMTVAMVFCLLASFGAFSSEVSIKYSVRDANYELKMVHIVSCEKKNDKTWSNVDGFKDI